MDPNLGWTYLRARWMDPETGRFASRDIFPESEFRPETINRYVYGYSSPPNRLDPTGLSSDIGTLLTVAAISRTAPLSRYSSPNRTPSGSAFPGSVSIETTGQAALAFPLGAGGGTDMGFASEVSLSDPVGGGWLTDRFQVHVRFAGDAEDLLVRQYLIGTWTWWDPTTGNLVWRRVGYAGHYEPDDPRPRSVMVDGTDYYHIDAPGIIPLAGSRLLPEHLPASFRGEFKVEVGALARPAQIVSSFSVSIYAPSWDISTVDVVDTLPVHAW